IDALHAPGRCHLHSGATHKQLEPNLVRSEPTELHMSCKSFVNKHLIGERDAEKQLVTVFSSPRYTRVERWALAGRTGKCGLESVMKGISRSFRVLRD